MTVDLGKRAREIENDEAKAVMVVQGCQALGGGGTTAAMELGPMAMAVRAHEQEGERDSAERERASTKALQSSASTLE